VLRGAGSAGAHVDELLLDVLPLEEERVACFDRALNLFTVRTPQLLKLTS
jgi:hypothetical protein